MQNLRSKYKGLKENKNSINIQNQNYESIDFSTNVNSNYNDTEITTTRNPISENVNNSN